MKRLVVLTILIAVLASLLLLGLSDTHISAADTVLPHNEIADSIGNTGNSSASGTITITMYAVDDK